MTVNLNKRLQQIYQQINRELQLVQRIQSSFLPRTLPAMPGCRFAVRSLSRRGVGGDFHDVFRLDEHHVGMYIGDALGHDMHASLLAIFVNKAIQPKEVIGSHYRLPPPREVLERLNKELIDQQLTEHPFLTMTYALYNHRDAAFRFGRAGHPYPLYVPKIGEPLFWRQDGLLLGVIDASFTDRCYPLETGDKVLMYSDGINAVCFEDQQSGADSLRACAARHRSLPIQEFVDRLALDLFAADDPPDDVTLLGLERTEGSAYPVRCEGNEKTSGATEAPRHSGQASVANDVVISEPPEPLSR